MSAIIARLKDEPAVAIGTIAACILAVVQTLAGREVISADVVATIGRALDPNTGWAIPILVGIVTRFFVSPARA